MKPDISFDITGDGCVSSKELLIGLRFDLDRDGKLNEKERAAMMEALRQGVENEFTFGLDAAAANHSKDPAVQLLRLE
jgi:hypothetical protein